MKGYSVFGGRLRSELDLADLREVSCAVPDWELCIRAGSAAGLDLDLLGTGEVTSSAQVRLFRHRAGLRLVFDDTGVFDLFDGGRSILWYDDRAASRDAAAMDVIGRVLPVALHMASTFTLHGSAVRLGDGAIAFLAPKHHGKSTLARALVLAGAELLTDDAVPVHLGSTITTTPGVRRVRLWADSAARLGALDGEVPPHVGKHLLDAGTADADGIRDADGKCRVPLRGIYLLAPVQPGTGRVPVRRVAISPVQATVALVAQMKLGALLGGAESGRVLRFCADVAGRVPVRQLEVVRDFSCLDDVVAELFRWHAAGSRPDELAQTA
jgi:hypothetical protein